MESTLSYLGWSGTVAAIWYARHRMAMPKRRVASRTMTIVSVILAFLRVGSRNAITPLLTASTPVMAVQPEAKTFRISQKLNAAVAGVTGGMGAIGWG